MQLSTAAILLAFISVCSAQATLFPTGGRCLRTGDGTNSGVKRFQFGDFNVYGTSYSHYVVHSDGYVTLTNSDSTGVYNSKDIVSLSSLTNGPMIAAFWGDVDDRPGGTIFYEETTDAFILTRVNSLVEAAFRATIAQTPPFAFTTISVMIATWQNVGYYECHCDQRNTFQVLLATGTATEPGSSGDSQSYIIYLYNSIDWTTTDSANDGTLPAQVGFTAGDGSDNTQSLLNEGLNNNINRLRIRLASLPFGTNNNIFNMNGTYVCRSDMPGSQCTQDDFLPRSQARANALAHLSSHPEKTQLYEEDVEAMEMELDSISNSPSEQVNEPQVQAEFYTEYNHDKNTIETDK